MTDEPDTLTGSLEASAERLNSRAIVAQLIALAASTGRTGLKWAATETKIQSSATYDEPKPLKTIMASLNCIRCQTGSQLRSRNTGVTSLMWSNLFGTSHALCSRILYDLELLQQTVTDAVQ